VLKERKKSRFRILNPAKYSPKLSAKIKAFWDE
jgi:hypothetical protein